MRRCVVALSIGAAVALLGALALPTSTLATTMGNGAWTWQNPLPQGDGYSNGYFLDATHGWLVSGGTIYHTADGGLTLTVQARHNVDFVAITFVGARHGWAVGFPAGPQGTGVLYRTVNGGGTWMRVRVPWRGGIRHVSFATTRTGWMTIGHAVLQTSDGGLHWRVSARGYRADAVQALTTRRVWVAAGDALLVTTNGGVSWRPVRVGGLLALTQVAFQGAESGWAAGLTKGSSAGQIAHTSDGGRTWQTQLSAGQATSAPRALSFADSHDGWATAAGSVLHTSDGGAHWVTQAAAPDSSWVDALTAADAVVGRLTGYPAGGVSRTTDGGATWQPSVRAAAGYGDFDAVQFVDDQKGWVVGDSEILATTDGGVTWTAQDPGTSESLTAVHFVDAANGWAVGGHGTIIHTSDGGATWAPQASGTSDDLSSVTFLDARDGWVTGSYPGVDDYSGGFILHTSDGGRDWTTQFDSPYSPTQGPGVDFGAVAFADPEDGWAVGETQGPDKGFNASVIMHTTDGGTTWTQQLDYYSNAGGNTDDDTLSSVACTSAGNAVAVGYDEDGAQIWHTANGGRTWARVGQKLWPLGSSVDLTDVVFADATNGWAISDGRGEVDPFTNLPVRCLGSAVIHTTDGGATWTRQLVPNDADAEPLDALSFVSPTRGWAVGADGDILTTTTGGNAP